MPKLISFLKKKINRLKVSKNYMKILYLLHKIFGETNPGNINFDFTDKPTRIEIIQSIINKKKYTSYLEIGTFNDELFSKIECEKKVGVDPFSGGTVRKTSDDFFKDNNDKFDCIFIDGLHEYHQVKKDINNAITILNHDGIIMVHDCLPSSVYAQTIHRCTYIWNGNVWKALVEKRTKKNLDCYTCYADQGIGVIFNRENKNILEINFSNFLKLRYKDFYKDHKNLMNIINYDELMKKI